MLTLAASAGPAALGARGPCDTPNGGLAGWCVGDAWGLTRTRGFAAANPGARLHLPASVVEVHVAARHLRRIVPLGIRPNGTIPLRGDRPSSGSTRPFELPSRVFYYAQSGSRDSPAQYAVRSAIGNTENCRSSQ